MLVTHVAEVPGAAARAGEQGDGERVHGGVAEALVVEARDARPVEVLEEARVGLGAEEAQVADLEVAEKLAVVVLARAVDEPGEVGVRVHQVRVLAHEVARDLPEAGEGARVVEDVHVEAVDQVVVAQEAEGIVGDVAEEVHVRLDAPVVVVPLERRVEVEEARVPPAHVAVREQVALSDPQGAQVGEGIVVAVEVDMLWDGPVVFGDQVVRCWSGRGVSCRGLDREASVR